MQFPLQSTFILTIADLYLAPIYILLLYLIIKRLRNKYYADSPIGKFIIPCFWIHVSSCIFFALVMQFYYGFGDLYGYYTGSLEIWNAFVKSTGTALELIFRSRDSYSPAAIAMAPYGSFSGFAHSLSTVIKMAGFVSLFCFGTYIPIALIFTMFSFWGTWLIFITINKYFPELYKFTGLATLFIPSVILWSSGISKEPPCMFALGLAFYSVDKLLHKQGFFKHIFYIIVASWILLFTKNYIFYTFLVAAIIWIFYFFISNLSFPILRFFTKSFIATAILAFFIYFFSVPDNPIRESFMTGLSKGENLQELMILANQMDGGTGYTLPHVELSTWGFVKSFFSSLNVTLFRPYLWETENILMFLSSFESFFTLGLMVLVVLKGGLGKLAKLSRDFPVIVFMLIFSLIFSPIVGFISFNFGTLVRYKIPTLPFFIPLLFILMLTKKNTAKEEVEELSEPFKPREIGLSN